jgi:hypothetical protein
MHRRVRDRPGHAVVGHGVDRVAGPVAPHVRVGEHDHVGGRALDGGHRRERLAPRVGVESGGNSATVTRPVGVLALVAVEHVGERAGAVRVVARVGKNDDFYDQGRRPAPRRCDASRRDLRRATYGWIAGANRSAMIACPLDRSAFGGDGLRRVECLSPDRKAQCTARRHL